MRTSGRQRGFALVTAIFLLVVLAALGGYMLTISSVQHTTPLFALQGGRAYHGAKTGIEWGIHQALNNTVATCGSAPSTPATNSFNLSSGGLNGFNLTVSCEYTRHQERNKCFNVYAITSTAQTGSFGQVDFAFRSLSASATDEPNVGPGSCP